MADLTGRIGLPLAQTHARSLGALAAVGSRIRRGFPFPSGISAAQI
jgi:hypothetical protein